MSAQRWHIVYPGGDLSKLAIALVFDYEQDDYQMASRNSWAFDNKDQAVAYAEALADQYGKTLTSDEFDRNDRHLLD